MTTIKQKKTLGMNLSSSLFCNFAITVKNEKNCCNFTPRYEFLIKLTCFVLIHMEKKLNWKSEKFFQSRIIFVVRWNPPGWRIVGGPLHICILRSFWHPPAPSLSLSLLLFSLIEYSPSVYVLRLVSVYTSHTQSERRTHILYTFPNYSYRCAFIVP